MVLDVNAFADHPLPGSGVLGRRNVFGTVCCTVILERIIELLD